jgi:hypothetical protein
MRHVIRMPAILGEDTTQTNLIKKGIVDNTACEVCQTSEEMTTHILFGCPNAQS